MMLDREPDEPGALLAKLILLVIGLAVALLFVAMILESR